MQIFNATVRHSLMFLVSKWLYLLVDVAIHMLILLNC